ncbi:phosphoribosyltransferase family protein [Streptomyces sp. NPDC050610]|uniref:ComF family protein n=1 Tax=Streptomyces sp. NPDC050610 TaxID=3157097 RepID=UPI0034144854
MRGWWQELVGLVLPVDCAGCGAPRAVLCDACREALCGRAARRVWPEPVPPGLPAVYAAVAYADEARSVLLAHKERGVLRLAGPLGTALASGVRAAVGGSGAWLGAGAGGGAGPLVGLGRGAGADGGVSRMWGRDADEAGGVGVGVAGGTRESRRLVLVPVPSARCAVAARGHDPSRRIAQAAAGELRRAGWPAVVCAVLRQRRPVADQTGLGARQRLDNLAGALEVAAGGERLLTAGPVLLVDDLMTTGASLVEAVRAVAAVGGRVAGAAVVAAPARAFGVSAK